MNAASHNLTYLDLLSSCEEFLVHFTRKWSTKNIFSYQSVYDAMAFDASSTAELQRFYMRETRQKWEKFLEKNLLESERDATAVVYFHHKIDPLIVFIAAFSR